MFYTVYITTNLVNGKKYIGKHETNDPNDSYMGSGIALIRAIKKYGKESFKKEIVFIFDNNEEMLHKEKELITNEIVISKQYYNIALGGSGGCIVLKEGHPLKEQTLVKIRESLSKSKEKRSEIVKELHRNKKVGMYGKKQTEYQKSVVSDIMKGKPKSDKSKEKQKNSWKKKIESGWVDPKLGVPKTEAAKKNMRLACQRKTASDNYVNPMKGKTHSEETKQKLRDKAKSRPRKKHSEETKQKMRDAKRKCLHYEDSKF